MIPALVAQYTVAGALTVYAEPYVGRPLFCSTPEVPLYYAPTTSPWVALPFRDYGITWQCGDLIYLRFANGDTLMARALDAGPFGAYCVMQPDGECLDIVADMPIYWTDAKLSMVGEAINISAVARACRERGWCDG